MMYLHHNDPVYKEAEHLFHSRWKHPKHKKAHIKAVLYTVHNGQTAQNFLAQYQAYSQSIIQHQGKHAEKMLFHGTKRACQLGDSPHRNRPCHFPECNLCHILKCTFSLGTAAASGLFGPGIYTTTRASKADRYFSQISSRMHSHTRCVILSNVVVGHTEHRYHADKSHPRPGYQSVSGVPGKTVINNHGTLLENDETVVYRTDAIRPTCVVVYTLH